MLPNGSFTLSAAAILVHRPGRLPPSSATPNDVDHSAGPSAHLTHLSGADAWSLENLCHQPVGNLSGLGSRCPSPDGCLSPSTHASQPYMACRLTVLPWNSFIQSGILKHDHEHWARALFSAKNCLRSSSASYGCQFLNRTYCMVPMRNWTKLKRTYPAPHWLPIGALQKDSTWPFSSTGHLLENHCQGPRHQTTIFPAILHGALDRADDARTLLQIWLTFYSMDWILRKRVRSLDLPPSLAVSALIVEPNARGLQDLVDNVVPTKFQRCSYLIDRAPRMNTLAHLWGSPWKHSDAVASGVTSKLKLLWLGSTKPQISRKSDWLKSYKLTSKLTRCSTPKDMGSQR